jgi:flagellar biosynthetic protein FliR
LDDLPLATIVFAAFLAFCRIGSCFMLMPGLSSMRVPMQVRLAVAVAVTWALIVHLWSAIVPNVELTPSAVILLILAEVLIGSTIGLVTRFYVLALQFAGTAMANMIGFNAMAGTAIEEMEPQPALTAFVTLCVLMVLFVFDFHHEVIKALVTSYQVAPLAGLFDPQSALIDLVDTLASSFYVALRLASPFIAYGILANLAIGFVNKLAPQIPVYFVSLPFIITGGLILIYFGIGIFLSLSADGFLPTTLER